MWCGKCYTSAPDPEFFTADPNNMFAEEGDEDRLVSGWKEKPSDKGRYTSARDGDDLLVSFECDTCVFIKMFQRLPDNESITDNRSLSCIRRVILDAFWSRARSTVNSNTLRYREIISLSESLGFEPPYNDPGPLPGFDHCGYKIAVLMVAKSLEAGRYSSTHTQWDTIRKLRSTYSNQIRASRIANASPLSLADTKGSGYQRITMDPCGSLWFHRFMAGCKKRMGQDWRPNHAISSSLMHRLLMLSESKMVGAENINDKHKWTMAGAYFCICYVLSLRSPEGLMVDLEGLIAYQRDTAESAFVVVPLMGQVKGEDHTRHHLLHCVSVTGSGIQVRWWIQRVLAVHLIRRRQVGPVFINPVTGRQSSTAEMNDLFLELLGDIFHESRDLFAVDIHLASELTDKYNVFRSFRRGSESQAVAMRVSEADRYVVNRWRKKETSGANKVSHPIDQHYVDVSLVKDSFLRYTKAM